MFNDIPDPLLPASGQDYILWFLGIMAQVAVDGNNRIAMNDSEDAHRALEQLLWADDLLLMQMKLSHRHKTLLRHAKKHYTEVTGRKLPSRKEVMMRVARG